MATWFVYVVRCADGTLYTGVSTDVERRVREHNESDRGARYTRTRRPVILVLSAAQESRSAALKAEAAFKKLSRNEKQAAIQRSVFRTSG